MVRRKKYRKNYNKSHAFKPCSRDSDETLKPNDNDTSSTNPITTPSCTPRPVPDRTKSRTSIKSTPVNRKRSNNHRRSSFNRTMNVTNLNILFDSSYINQNASPQEEKRCCMSPRSNESTQTINIECEMKSSPAIVETPKLSQFSMIEELVSQIRSPPKGAVGCNKSKIHYLDSNVNLNPYVNNADFKVFPRDPSLGEISFFTPHLYNLKSASTPIDKIASNFIKNSLIKESPKNVNNLTDDTVKVDKLNFQSTPFLQAEITDKPISNLHKTISPKTQNKSKHFTIVHNLSRISKTNSGYRTFSSDLQDKQSNIEIVFNRLKKLSRTSIHWTYKIVDFCSYIGVVLKKSLSSICGSCRVENRVEEIQHKLVECKCLEYQTELKSCTSEIGQLKNELFKVRSQVEIHKENEDKVMQLTEELRQIKESLQQFRDLRMEFQELKERMKGAPVVSCAAPPPPPPPPPLPPPAMKTSPVKIVAKKSSKSNKENSRPIISLDDILKVKLKKTTDRPTPHRRVSQPTVSTEMLKQVKLKPPSRPHTPIIDDVGTSPRSSHSSLTRLLSDNSVWKVKRLKRVGGYSFDDVSRRNLLAKRERERTYN